jgi:hypothetical protein
LSSNSRVSKLEWLHISYEWVLSINQFGHKLDLFSGVNHFDLAGSLPFF